jgi:hypothetical protein
VAWITPIPPAFTLHLTKSDPIHSVV